MVSAAKPCRHNSTIARIAGAVALLVAFVVIELRTTDPLMPLAIFRLRTLRWANAVALLVGMSLFSMFFFISLYMQQVLHFSALHAGVSYLPLAVAITLYTLLQQRSERWLK